MRFLADERCDFAVVRALRSEGHEVVAVAEVAGGAADDVDLAIAASGDAVLLTEDKDFGQLVHAARQQSGGVIVVRFPAGARAILAATLVTLVHDYGERLVGRFVVVQPGRAHLT